jgi:hypothetical protein
MLTRNFIRLAAIPYAPPYIDRSARRGQQRSGWVSEGEDRVARCNGFRRTARHFGKLVVIVGRIRCARSGLRIDLLRD